VQCFDLLYGAGMTRAQFIAGQRVIVTVWGEGEWPAVVVDKTRGAATKLRFDDGTVMLVSNNAIRAA
jgi:hypothetical protein